MTFNDPFRFLMGILHEIFPFLHGLFILILTVIQALFCLLLRIVLFTLLFAPFEVFDLKTTVLL